MEIKTIKIKDLRPAEYNPRHWDEKAISDLERSIERFGIVDPLIVNSAPGRENVVIGGHFRLYVAKKMGMETVPVVYVNIPDKEKEKELNLRLNRNFGEWDIRLLSRFDESLLIDVGFTGDEIDNIFGLEEAEEFDVEKEKEKILEGEELRTALGQIWQLGDHKLIIGDSTARENWEKLLGDERFDFMFTDPPYRLAYSKKRVRKVKTKDGFKIKRTREYESVGSTDREGRFVFGLKKNRSYQGVEMKRGVPEFDEWLSIANDFKNQKASNVFVFENWRNLRELWSAVEKYWKVINLVIWHTPNRMQGFTRADVFYNKYDIAIYGESGEVRENDEPEIELEKFMEMKAQKLIETFDVAIYGHSGERSDIKAKGKKEKWGKLSDHVTWSVDSESNSGQSLVFGTKPIQILTPYMKALSPRGGIVMEPFGGSGSTIIAAEIMRRKCRAIELSPLYAEVILRRWEKYTNKKAERIN
jgi:DNA modification methylase